MGARTYNESEFYKFLSHPRNKIYKHLLLVGLDHLKKESTQEIGGMELDMIEREIKRNTEPKDDYDC